MKKVKIQFFAKVSYFFSKGTTLRTAILKNISERLPLIFNKNFNQTLHEQKHVTFNNAVTISLTFKILSQPSQTQKPPNILFTKTTGEYWRSLFFILFFPMFFINRGYLSSLQFFWDFKNFHYLSSLTWNLSPLVSMTLPCLIVMREGRGDYNKRGGLVER